MVLPTVNCLVELTQMPFTVVSLADIEIVNLERVGFNLKNFDMAIVFKVNQPRCVLHACALPPPPPPRSMCCATTTTTPLACMHLLSRRGFVTSSLGAL